MPTSFLMTRIRTAVDTRDEETQNEEDESSLAHDYPAVKLKVGGKQRVLDTSNKYKQ